MWVPECGLFYWEGRRHHPDAERWTEDEFESIAVGQARFEDSLAPMARRVLVCDAGPLATSIFARRYLGHRSPVVEEMAAGRLPGGYIITGDGIPFIQDGTRELEAQRAETQQWFRE